MWCFLKCLFLFIGLLGALTTIIVILEPVLFLFWAATHRTQGHVEVEAVHPALTRIYTQFPLRAAFLSSPSRAPCGF